MHPFSVNVSPLSLNSAVAIAYNGLKCSGLPREEQISRRKAAMAIFWWRSRRLPIALR